jgi:adenosine deaminase CECR1
VAAIFVPMKRRLLRSRKKRGDPPKADVIINDVKMVDAPNHVTPDLKQTFERYLQNGAEYQKLYEKHKKDLLETEIVEAWDRQARNNASDAEMMANTIIWRIREDERDNLFGNKASESIPAPTTRDMGGQFLTNRDRIEGQSKVFRIAQEMPKGCHLHLHFNAEIPPPILIEKARDISNMFVRSTLPIVKEKDYAETEMVFNVMPENTLAADIFCPDYKPDWKAPGAMPWMKWSDFRREYQARWTIDATPRDKDAEDWIRKKMILSEEEVYGISQTTNG